MDSLLKRAYARATDAGPLRGQGDAGVRPRKRRPWSGRSTSNSRWGVGNRPPPLVRRQFERELPVAPVEEVSLTLSSITGEVGTQAGLFRDAQKDRDVRLLDAGRQIQARINGNHALYRVVDVAPWHPAPEMRAGAGSHRPVGRGGMKPLSMPVSMAVQEGSHHEPVAVLLDEQWHALNRHRGQLALRPLVDAAAGEPRLLPGEPPRGGIACPVPRPDGLLLVPADLLAGHSPMTTGYVELHAKSFYSFGAGASHAHELLAQAKEHGHDALALTDTNLCGALEFARLGGSLGVRPITGGEITLLDGSRLVLLARSRQGYANISRLFTLPNAADRREPRLDPAHLREYADGVVLLTGGRTGHWRSWRSMGGTETLKNCSAAINRGTGAMRSTWSCSRTSCRATHGAIANWRGWPTTWRAGGRHQRRPLPRPGALPAAAGAGVCEAQHHHRPGAPLHPPQPPPAPEIL